MSEWTELLGAALMGTMKLMEKANDPEFIERGMRMKERREEFQAREEIRQLKRCGFDRDVIDEAKYEYDRLCSQHYKDQQARRIEREKAEYAARMAACEAESRNCFASALGTAAERKKSHSK